MQSFSLQAGHQQIIPSFLCSRVFIDPRGSLVISVAVKGDQGRYQCSAKNLAATRDTRPVRLRIQGKKMSFSVGHFSTATMNVVSLN